MKLVVNLAAAALLGVAGDFRNFAKPGRRPEELEAQAKKLVRRRARNTIPSAKPSSGSPRWKSKPLDWPQWGGSPFRNNTPLGKDIPTEWDVDSGKNIMWEAQLGSQTYGNPVVANGKVYVGTNNAGGCIGRYPWNNQIQVDLGCLLCFDEKTGKFLWQHSSPKLPSGRVHDWPLQGICCASYVDGERLWYVTSRGEVALPGHRRLPRRRKRRPLQSRRQRKQRRSRRGLAAIDMMGQLGTSQHNMCSCSVTCAGDILFVNTSNGVDESHINLPAPNAPSFIADGPEHRQSAVDRQIPRHQHPARPMVLADLRRPGRPRAGAVRRRRRLALQLRPQGRRQRQQPNCCGSSTANPKESKWILGGRGTRNNIIATPVVYDGMVYVAVGQDPEHGEGDGHLWCIDPTGEATSARRLAQDANGKPIPHRRIQAVDPERRRKDRAQPQIQGHLALRLARCRRQRQEGL